MDGSGKTLRRAGIVAAVVAVATCFAAPSASAAPLLFSGNYDGKSVSAFDALSGAPAGSIPLASEASSIAIVPGGQAFVAELNEDAVTVIDTKTLKAVKTIPVGDGPEYIAVSPDGKTAYVADANAKEVTVIDTATDTVRGSIPLGGLPYGISFTPDGKFAYVTVGGTIETIDTAAREVVGEPIPVGERPRNIAFTPDGKTAYVSEEEEGAVGIIDTALRKEVGSISLPSTTNPWGVAVSPDGTRLYISDEVTEGTVTVISTATNKQIAPPIPVGETAYELALTPDGKTLWVATYDSEELTPIDTATLKAGTPISMAGLGPWQLAITPDLSPTAAFTVPSITAGFTATFDGSASTDPDGTVASYAWAFGDGSAALNVSATGTTATGSSAIHTYAGPGTYPAQLTVGDNEGCGVEEVFTGRTAYCSGNAAAKVAHPVVVPAPPSTGPTCSSKFTIGGVSHNRKNGTVRLRVRFPSTGWFLLFGKKIHAVTRKVRKAGVTMVTLHARVELNKRLKKTLRASVRYRITFTPSAGCGSKTVHRSVALLRAPRKHHHR